MYRCHLPFSRYSVYRRPKLWILGIPWGYCRPRRPKGERSARDPYLPSCKISRRSVAPSRYMWSRTKRHALSKRYNKTHTGVCVCRINNVTARFTAICTFQFSLYWAQKGSHDRDRAHFCDNKCKQELSYRQQIARQLRTQYDEGIYRHKYYTVTLKSRLKSFEVTGNGTIHDSVVFELFDVE